MRRDYLLLTGLGFLLFVPMLGGVHLFDWDEINFAECSREMVLTGDWFRPQIDYEPFWEKPPLFIWMQALSMHFFGINEFAARLPNALCGIATLLVAYRIGSRLHDRLFGWLWALAWVGSLLPHFYFRSGIIDPWFNFLIFIGLYGFIKFRWQFFSERNGRGFWSRHRDLLIGGFVLGLAILTKGPTAYLIALLVLLLYWARYGFRNRGFFKHLVLYSLAAGVAAALWFGLEVALHGPWFVREFIVYQIRLFSTPDAGHGGFFGYHFVVLLLGCFPVSIFALPNLWGDRQAEDEVLESDTLAMCQRSDLATWMQLLFWVVLILFTIVKTKIVHYSSLCYWPLTYLGALTLWRAIRWDVRPRVVKWVLPAVGIVLGLVGAALPFVGQNIELLRPLFARDAFAQGNLEAAVEWNWWQALPGLVLVAATIAGLVLWQRYRAWDAAQVLFAGGATFMAGTLLLNISNIEAYSQRAAIEFYKDKCGEDAYVRTVGFKSYAHLFYTCKPPVEDPTRDDLEVLLHGRNPGKKVYLVAKVSNLTTVQELPDAHELYRKNGFVFYERTPQ